MKRNQLIDFDADDTLWVNEPFFQDIEREFKRLLSDYADQESISEALFSTDWDKVC